MRFVSRFSREKLRGPLKRGGPHVQRGEDFGGFLGKPENPGFQVLGNSDKLATVLGLANIVSGVQVDETGSARPEIAAARVFFIGEHQETCELLPWGG